jgi:exodeoxyribonuclease VII large subunit
MENNKAISLQELNLIIKKGVRELFPNSFWIIAEISELNVNQSGHCYLELIEKAAETEQITAKAKATIWSYTFRMLKPYFESTTHQRFTNGIKVMLSVSIDFHELYGFSLNVKDIEPNYTLGDLSRKKQQIIQQLQDEGVFHLNKELEFPIVPQKIAVISSETAAGYGDFIKQLTQNRFHYKYYIKLFNAYMQGDEAEKSITSALDQIFEFPEPFDVVVIIRGGGSQSDLNCFNSYWLCYHITQFPIPVITGIGHDRDQTIADMVAHTSVKTPTAVAEFIIENTTTFESHLLELQQNISDIVNDKLELLHDQLNDISTNLTSFVKLTLVSKKSALEKYNAILSNQLKSKFRVQKNKLQNLQERFIPSVYRSLNAQNKQLVYWQTGIKNRLKSSMSSECRKLENFTTRSQLLNPVNILKKGYTLTYKDGLLIKSSSQLKPGDTLTSKWIDGTAQSSVKNIVPESQ